MYNKRIICAALSAAAVCGIIPQSVQAMTNDEIAKKNYAEYAKDSNGVTWFYTVDDDKNATIWGTNDNIINVKVPETINGCKVCTLDSIYINADLTYDVNPNGYKVQSVEIPSSITNIGSDIFGGFVNLKSIKMPEDVYKTMDKSAFVACPDAKINGVSHSEFRTLKNKLGYKAGFNNTDDGHKIFAIGAFSNQKGWMNYNNKRYYFYTQTGYMATGFIKLGDVHYYLDESQNNQGNLVTGWKKINGYWYYFAKPGEAKYTGLMTKGWKIIGGSWYYFYGSGKMACNTTVGGYRLGSSGALIR